MDAKVIYRERLVNPEFKFIKWVPFVHIYNSGGGIKIVK
jgi:hypothetical protein